MSFSEKRQGYEGKIVLDLDNATLASIPNT
jgi:hypothetical protein